MLRYLGEKHGRDLIHARQIKARMLADCFREQREFAADDAPTVALHAGRRGGKTSIVLRKMFIKALENPNAFTAYISLTRIGAKKLLWDKLLTLNRKYSVGGIPNTSDLTLKIPNGNTIFLGGCEDESEVEKYRSYGYGYVAIDESGSFPPYIKKLVEDAVEPACAETDGQIHLIGTPGPVCDGYYYDITANPKTPKLHVPTYRWTCRENIYAPNAAAYMASVKERRGWTDETPTFKREWLGLWVPDTDALCYFYDPEINGWDGVLPQVRAPWEATLGVDVGYEPDPTGFVLLKHARDHDTAYVTRSEKHLRMLPSDIATHMQAFCENENVTNIVVDVGGSQNMVKEWATRFRVPLRAPYKKSDKRAHIELLNNDLRRGKVKIKDGLPLIHEMRTVVWDDNREAPDKRYPNDLCDGLEYAHVSSLHYTARNKADEPQTPEEKYEREAEQYEKRLVRSMQREHRRRRLAEL